MATTPQIIPLSEAVARLHDLADEVVGGSELVLTKADGSPYVALIDAKLLQYYRALEAELEHLLTMGHLRAGLEDVAAGRVLTEAELARALSELPVLDEKHAAQAAENSVTSHHGHHPND